MRLFERLLPTILIIIAVLITIFSINIASQRPLSNLENTLFQAFALFAGLTGSFIFGKRSAKDSAREIIKPHARSAFRRIISLYMSLSRVVSEIQNYWETEEIDKKKMSIAKLEAIVVEQLTTADDALEDWGDIIPEDVEELRSKLEKHKTEGNQ
jgi:predicted DNA-binding protein (UPF0278 family)